MEIVTVHQLKKYFGKGEAQVKALDGIDLSIEKGKFTAIIGASGSGKTTLLKILNGLLPADQGSFRLGTNVEIGYYDQEHHVLHAEKTLFEEISDENPTLSNTEIRNLLAAFLFTGDDVFKRIEDLSGGERGRVSLAKLMLGNANFLILDEPTNHLDIVSKEILEDALNRYEGTVLYVSHDRYFINKTAGRILELKAKQFVNYIGNYDYYLEKQDAASTTDAAEIQASAFDTAMPVSASGTAASDGRLDWKAKKEEQARIRKRENDLKKCEERITALEERNAEIDMLMAAPSVATQAARLQEFATEQAAIGTELERLYEQWAVLAE